MATIQILDEKKYAKASGLLYEMGGIFRTKPTRQIVVRDMGFAISWFYRCIPLTGRESSHRNISALCF